MKGSKDLALKINNYALLAFAFTLGFPRLVFTYVLVFWLISCFFCLKPQKISFYYKKQYIPVALLILLTIGRIIISFIHGDTGFLLNQIILGHLQILLLVFLIIISLGFRNEKFELKKIIFSYILGAFIGTIVSILYFYFLRLFVPLEKLEPFMGFNYNIVDTLCGYQNYISMYFKHRAGFAAFISFAIALSFFYLNTYAEETTLKKKLFLIFIIILLIFPLYASGSRAGYISLFGTILIGLIYTLRKHKLWLVISLAAFILLFSGLLSAKTTRDLIIKDKESLTYEKLRLSDPRFIIWECATELIKENPHIGVGSKDIKPILWNKFKENGFEEFAIQKYNTHNQFLQFSLESGIWAGICFLLVILPIYYKRKQLFIAFSFFIIFMVYSSFEDTFLGLLGIMLFIFFMIIMLCVDTGSTNLPKGRIKQ